MSKEEFNLEKFKELMGLNEASEPYDYEKYRAINPKLTKKMYGFCYHNHTLWKIRCGKRVVMKFENEILEAVWWLDTHENNQNKYIS